MENSSKSKISVAHERSKWQKNCHEMKMFTKREMGFFWEKWDKYSNCLYGYKQKGMIVGKWDKTSITVKIKWNETKIKWNIKFKM